MAHIISKKSVFVCFLFKNGSGVTKIVINYFRFFNIKEHVSHPKSEMPSLIITKFGLNYSYYALNKKTRKMTGHQVSFLTTDWEKSIGLSWQIFIKMVL